MVRRSVPLAESEEHRLGARWEQRRSIFLENSVGNKYFVYTAALSLLLTCLVVVVAWQRWDHAERLKALGAEHGRCS